MSFVCNSCGDKFQSTKGLNSHHRLYCVALAEQEASLPVDALQLYQKKQEKKRRRLEAEKAELAVVQGNEGSSGLEGIASEGVHTGSQVRRLVSATRIKWRN